MSSLPPIENWELGFLVSYLSSDGEGMAGAVRSGFQAANLHICRNPTTLGEQVDPDIFKTVERADRPVYLGTHIGNPKRVITGEEIQKPTTEDFA
ncbi:MAG: hypothetical protein ACOCTH_01880 [Halodesulfurarchaeum sp.]